MLPDVIRSRARASAEDRLGLSLTIGSVQLTASGVELGDLHFAAENDGLVVRADKVRASLDFLRLPFTGREAVRQVDVGSLDIVVRGPSPALGRLLPINPPGAASQSTATPQSALPPFTIGGVRLQAGDTVGVLVEANCPLIRYAGATLTAEEAELTVGTTATGMVDLHDVSVTATRSDLWRLSSAQVGTARVHLPSTRANVAEPATGEPGGPPPPGPNEPPAVVSAPPPTVSPQPHAPGPLARLRALVGAVGAEATDDGAEARTGKPPVDLLLRRMSADATVALLEGSVVATVGGKPQEMLRALKFNIVRGPDGEWKFDGEARGATGGVVRWAFAAADEPISANGRLDVEAMPLPLVARLLPDIPWHAPERSHLSARLVLETKSVDRIGVSGVVDLTDASIASDRVAPVPVEDLDVSLSGQGYFMPLERKLEIETGWFAVGDVRVDVEGSVAINAGRYAADIRTTLEQTSCDKAIRATPPALLGDLVHASWDGTIAGGVALQIDSERLAETKLDIAVTDRCGFVTVPAIVDLRRFRLPFVHTVLEPDGTVVELETGPGTTTWTYLEDVSPFLVHAVLSHEDSRFFSHGGFSPPHIRNALVKNLEQGRYVVGASTITMQLVKNIFLRREKTLARKTQEVLLTWWIERVMEKRDILELYLNVIEYGPGVYGIRNAAMHYFKRLPSDLSPAEAVYLSTILPNPRKYYGAYERGSISERWADRMRKIFARLRARARYTQEATAYGLSELQAFRFVKEGEFASARQVLGGSAPLPYMGTPGGWGAEPGASEPAAETEGDDAWDEDSADRTDPPNVPDEAGY